MSIANVAIVILSLIIAYFIITAMRVSRITAAERAIMEGMPYIRNILGALELPLVMNIHRRHGLFRFSVLPDARSGMLADEFLKYIISINFIDTKSPSIAKARADLIEASQRKERMFDRQNPRNRFKA